MRVFQLSTGMIVLSLLPGLSSGQTAPVSLQELAQERRAEFEHRYGYDEWPGRSSPPLLLGRFHPAPQITELSVSASSNPSESSLGPSGGLIDVLLWHSLEGEPIADSTPARLRIWIYPSASVAQDALMASLSRITISAPPLDPPALPWGEVLVEGIGDLCLARHLDAERGGRIQCITSNIVFTLEMGPAPNVENPDNSLTAHLLDIATALSQKLRDTDAQVRAGVLASPTTMLARAATVDYGAGRQINELQLDVIGQAPLQDVVLNARGEAFVALAPQRAPNSPVPVVEKYAVSQGDVRYLVNDADGSTYVDGVRFGSSDVGPQTVYYLAQYEDGSFEFTQTTITVHAN